MKELNDADIAFFKELANETGRVIKIEKGSPLIHDIDKFPPNE